MHPIILASGSPRRREFLEMLGLEFTIHTADIDESPHPKEAPLDLVQRLSHQKAQVVATQYPDAIVIGADTIVVFEDLILGKPADATDARKMLTQLRGLDHQVCSSVTVYQHSSQKTSTHLSQTTVTMRDYTDAEMDAYIATGDPLDKAGAYAIQHPEFAPAAQMGGCYAGVMGLPLGLLAEGLAEFGIVLENLGSRCAAFTGQPCCLVK